MILFRLFLRKSENLISGRGGGWKFFRKKKKLGGRLLGEKSRRVIFSIQTQSKLSKITKKYCKHSNSIIIAVRYLKISSIISVRDKILSGLRCYILCEFVAAVKVTM